VPLNPFLYAFFATLAAAQAGEGLNPSTTLGGLGGLVVALYGLYKLGTIESVAKIILAVVLGVTLLYTAGIISPGLREATWYQLVAYLVERAPTWIIEQLEQSMGGGESVF